MRGSTDAYQRGMLLTSKVARPLATTIAFGEWYMIDNMGLCRPAVGEIIFGSWGGHLYETDAPGEGQEGASS